MQTVSRMALDVTTRFLGMYMYVYTCTCYMYVGVLCVHIHVWSRFFFLCYGIQYIYIHFVAVTAREGLLSVSSS